MRNICVEGIILGLGILTIFILLNTISGGESATIIAIDWYENQKEYYEQSETIYFSIHSEDIINVEVNVTLKDELDDEIWTENNVWLDSDGDGLGNYNYFENYGAYTIEVEYNGTIIGSTELNIIGNCNINIQDKYDLFAGNELSFTVDLNQGTAVFNIYITDNEGFNYNEWNDIIFPTTQTFSWRISETGSYNIQVKGSNYDESIESDSFFADQINCNVIIEDDRLSPGDTVKFTIYAYSGSSNIDVYIVDENDKTLSRATWLNKAIDEGNPVKLSYKLPEDINDGEYEIEVCIYDTETTIGFETFNVKSIDLEIDLDGLVYLPGASIKVYYSLTKINDGKGVENCKIDWNLSYYRQKTKGKSYKEDMIKTDKSAGSFDIQLPNDAVPGDYNLKVTGKDYSDNSSDIKDTEFYVGPPSVDVNIIISEGDPTKDSKPLFKPNDFIIIDLEARAGGGMYWYGYTSNNERVVFYEDLEYTETREIGTPQPFPTTEYKYKMPNGEDVWLGSGYLNYDDIYQHSPLKGKKVNIQIYLYEDDKYTKIDKYEASSLTTDYSGHSRYIFTLGTLKDGEYRVNGTVSGISNIPEKVTTGSDTFTFSHTSTMLLFINPEKSTYKPGDMVKVQYSLTYVDGGNVGEVTFDYEAKSNNIIIDKDRFTSSRSNGNFSFTIPDDFNIEFITIRLIATNSTNDKETASIFIYCSIFQLILNSEKITYRPEDTITAKYELIGQSSGMTFYQKVIGNYYGDDKTVLNKKLTSIGNSGTISYEVPGIGYASEYTIKIYGIDSNGNYIEDEVRFSFESIIFTFEFDKDSYKPGDDVVISYKVSNIDGGKIEGPFNFIYSIFGIQSGIFESMETEGKIKFSLTDKIANGNYVILISWGDSGEEQTIRTIHVEEKGFFMFQYEFIILIISSIALVLGILSIKNVKGGKERVKTQIPTPPPPMQELPMQQQFPQQSEQFPPSPKQQYQHTSEMQFQQPQMQFQQKPPQPIVFQQMQTCPFCNAQVSNDLKLCNMCGNQIKN